MIQVWFPSGLFRNVHQHAYFYATRMLSEEPLLYRIQFNWLGEVEHVWWKSYFWPTHRWEKGGPPGVPL
jgi:hypothetical protein